MYRKTRLAIALATIITPAFFAAGCSSTQGKSSEYTVSSISSQDAREQNTNNMDAAAMAPEKETTERDSEILEENALISELIAEPEQAGDAQITDTNDTIKNSEDNVLEEIATTLETYPTPDQEPEAISQPDVERPALTLFKFGFDKKELSDQEEAILIQHGEFLSQHPDKKIQLHGHADAQGDPAYNQYLATQRANYVAELLKAQGVSKDQIEIFSWGSDKPQTAANQWKDNRRVELFYEESFMVQVEEDKEVETSL